jgi:hypothetical protein
MQQLDLFVREHLKKVLKTNGTTDEEINLSIKNIQDMISKVSVVIPQISTRRRSKPSTPGKADRQENYIHFLLQMKEKGRIHGFGSQLREVEIKPPSMSDDQPVER